jgi:hypothetical protein
MYRDTQSKGHKRVPVGIYSKFLHLLKANFKSMEGDETQLVRQLAAIPDANVNWQINKYKN